MNWAHANLCTSLHTQLLYVNLYALCLGAVFWNEITSVRTGMSRQLESISIGPQKWGLIDASIERVTLEIVQFAIIPYLRFSHSTKFL